MEQSYGDMELEKIDALWKDSGLDKDIPIADRRLKETANA